MCRQSDKCDPLSPMFSHIGFCGQEIFLSHLQREQAWFSGIERIIFVDWTWKWVNDDSLQRQVDSCQRCMLVTWTTHILPITDLCRLISVHHYDTYSVSIVSCLPLHMYSLTITTLFSVIT